MLCPCHMTWRFLPTISPVASVRCSFHGSISWKCAPLAVPLIALLNPSVCTVPLNVLPDCVSSSRVRSGSPLSSVLSTPVHFPLNDCAHPHGESASTAINPTPCSKARLLPESPRILIFFSLSRLTTP